MPGFTGAVDTDRSAELGDDQANDLEPKARGRVVGLGEDAIF